MPEQTRLEDIMGPAGPNFLNLLHDFRIAHIPTRYEFMETNQYKELFPDKVSLAMQIYWRESAQRAHLAATTGLLRMERWLSGADLAIKAGNYHLAMAALRGLLEAAADTDTSLRSVPCTIGQSSKVIEAAERLELKAPHVCGDLEDSLIHFQFARKMGKSEEAPATHRAKTTRAYLEHMEGEDGSIIDLYEHLCEITHPAASSLESFASQSHGSASIVITDADESHLGYFGRRFGDAWLRILALGVNSSLLTLICLRRLPYDDLHTSYAETVDMTRLPIWSKIETAFDTADEPSTDAWPV